MPKLIDSRPPAEVPPPGPPTDYLAPGPQTLRGPWSSPTDFPVNVCIPGYELLGELGRGGMGVVYKARHVGLNRVIALKVMLSGAFASTAEKARFRLEAESVARLHHPNVVQVYDVGEHGGIGYIAFEYVDGPTLRRWQRGRPVLPRYAAGIAARIARAVQHAHDARIVHRDLKPANILLVLGREDSAGSSILPAARDAAPTPTPKVTDFGLAKPLENAADLTASGIACGTPNYMAPEQVRGGPGAAVPSADVWGVGTVLYEMLTGRPPFAGTDAAGIMNDILLYDPPPVAQFVPAVPRDLAVIVGKCLEKEPARRYLTAAAVADDLERFLRGEAILARPAGAARRAARWVVRNPAVAALVGVLVLGLAGVSAFAVALLRSVEREQAAVAEEGRLRQRAGEATTAAELARDETHAALARVEEALGRAGEEKDRTAEALGRAEAEKRRAEENFAIARDAVRHVVAVIRSDPGEDPAHYLPLYRDLLVGVEPFLARFLGQKVGDPEIRYEQAVLARDLGGIEGDLGRASPSRDYFLRSAALLRELAAEYPGESRYRRTLGYSLAMAGAASASLGQPDAPGLLRDGLSELRRYVAEFPDDAEGIDFLIRASLAISRGDGPDATDEYDLAVLDLLDRQETLLGPRRDLTQTRAHALNNVASLLTNRGKTDEAEMYWLQVLALREELARALPHDKLARFELAKCLFNYANQLHKTGRGDASLAARERAARIFDALRPDAPVRTAYIPAMVANDQVLAREYARRGELDKAAARLTGVIRANGVLVERNPDAVHPRAVQADAFTARAELAERAGRHADAARDYCEAVRLSTRLSHKEFCSARLVAALARAGSWSEAGKAAAGLDPEAFSHPLPCVELARGWLLLARAAADDDTLPDEERGATVAEARAKARAAVAVASKRGMFADPQQVRWFHAEKDFEPIWDEVPRAEK